MTSDKSANNKRIAKNTGFLYFRMLFTMLITFYTSRVVLERLGVNNYGIYDVVGGVVTMFSILSSSLTTAISRFLTYELGKEKHSRLGNIFSTSVWIQTILGIIVILLIETFGLWFLNNKMTIAPERVQAARWVLQCSAATFFVNMLSVPYNAAIIAHERMQAFAYVSILEAALKLGVAFLLYISFFDSLIAYAILIFLTSLIIRFTYSIYCRRHFEECYLKFIFDRNLLKEMLMFSGWNFIGSASAILRDQGVNIIINIFFGTALNAARGIAMQVYRGISGFSQNFMLAVNPQIIKSYVSGDYKYMFKLAFQSTRFSYYLLFCLSMPLILEMRYILPLWLEVVPDDAGIFSILMLIFGMSEALSIPLQFINHATGRLKTYQLTVGLLQACNFPLVYLLFKMDFPPTSAFILAIVISQLCLAARLIVLHRSVGLNVIEFLKEVYWSVMAVTIIGSILPYLISLLFVCENWISLIGACFIEGLFCVIGVWVIGCKKDEQRFISSKIKTILIEKRRINF